MTEGILQQRDIVEYAGQTYRILQIDDYFILSIRMNTPKTLIRLFGKEELEGYVNDKLAVLKNEEKSNIRYVHPDHLQGASRRIYNEYKQISEEFFKHSPSYDWLLDKQEKAMFIEEFSKEHQISLTTTRRRLRDFLQNGMVLRGLESKYYNCGGKGKERIYSADNRPGKKGFSKVVRDEKTISILDKMTKRYMAAQGNKSITTIYNDMIAGYYSEKVVGGEFIPYPLVSCPSKRQLYYHISKRVGGLEDYIMRNGYKKA